jgi:hypothetical protein
MAQKATVYICLSTNTSEDIEVPGEGAITMFMQHVNSLDPVPNSLASRINDKTFHYFGVGGFPIQFI